MTKEELKEIINSSASEITIALATELLALREQLAALKAQLLKPVVLPQRYECEGYHIGEAYLDPNPEGDCFDRDEVIEAIKKAGFTVAGE